MAATTSTVDLVMGEGSKVWHIVWAGGVACGEAVRVAAAEEKMDGRVVSHRGKPVCARCRRRVVR